VEVGHGQIHQAQIDIDRIEVLEGCAASRVERELVQPRLRDVLEGPSVVPEAVVAAPQSTHARSPQQAQRLRREEATVREDQVGPLLRSLLDECEAGVRQGLLLGHRERSWPHRELTHRLGVGRQPSVGAQADRGQPRAITNGERLG